MQQQAEEDAGDCQLDRRGGMTPSGCSKLRKKRRGLPALGTYQNASSDDEKYQQTNYSLLSFPSHLQHLRAPFVFVAVTFKYYEATKHIIINNR